MGLLQRIDTQLELFRQMSGHAEVGFEGASGFTLEQDMRRAVARCIFCRHSQACSLWLQGEAEGRNPGFCPNAAYFARYGGAETKADARLAA